MYIGFLERTIGRNVGQVSKYIYTSGAREVTTYMYVGMHVCRYVGVEVCRYVACMYVRLYVDIYVCM